MTRVDLRLCDPGGLSLSQRFNIHMSVHDLEQTKDGSVSYDSVHGSEVLRVSTNTNLAPDMSKVLQVLELQRCHFFHNLIQDLHCSVHIFHGAVKSSRCQTDDVRLPGVTYHTIRSKSVHHQRHSAAVRRKE